MLPNAPASGIDRLTELAAVAAERAGRHLVGRLRLTGCEVREIESGLEPLSIEAWPVRVQPAAVTVAVVGLIEEFGGARRTAAHGRFTFMSR